jgi:hypothetical protein
MKRRALLIAVSVVFAAGVVITLAGVRVIQLPPEDDRPGQTQIMAGLYDIRLIESPESYCRRTGDNDPTCPMSFRLAIAREGSVLFSLPYSSFLTPASTVE